jgi:chromosome segregation ATPase
MKNKDVEDIVKKALDEYSSKHETWCPDIDTITKEAFAAHRTKAFDEANIKRLNTYLESKDEEIWQHQKAIDDLRGYIDFLESRIESLKRRLGEHEDSY